MRVAQQYSFSGPLPPPEILAKYNEALPGLAERIICMAEQQAKHRQSIEKTVIDSNAFVQKVGPFLGFVVAMTAVIGGTILVLKGKDGYGARSHHWRFSFACGCLHIREETPAQRT